MRNFSYSVSAICIACAVYWVIVGDVESMRHSLISSMCFMLMARTYEIGGGK